MVFTLPGMVTEVSIVQPEKASLPMAVTLTPPISSGISAAVTPPSQPVTVPVSGSKVRFPPVTGQVTVFPPSS